MDKATLDAKDNKETIEIDIKEEKYRLYASIAFITVVLLIGVPMWWKTTEVYRVSLPYADINSLSDTPIRSAVRIRLFALQQQRMQLLVKELQKFYEHNDRWLLTFEQITPSEKAKNAKTPAALETAILKEHPLNSGDFMFIEWPKLQEEVLMTTERSALMRTDTSALKLRDVIDRLILQISRVEQILTKNIRTATKSEAPQAEYDVVVSVLNPRPDYMNVKWNVRMATQTYLAPFLQHVSQISNYTLKTQWKFQLPFEANLRQVRDDTKLGRHYALEHTALPHIITAVEKNLGVGITAKPAINLVVYVPPCEIAPVHIYNSQNKRATEQNVDAFISPKWGGIIIANPPTEACLAYMQKPQTVGFYVNTNDVMQIMLHQLHKLLDISVEYKMNGVKNVELEQVTPRLWEYDAYIRRSAIMHIATATNTLQSLIKLLDNINYIVINDEVGNAINAAYNDILLAKTALAANQLLNASNYAKRAFAASEQAFFDASLLAQLYFPDEQKYAIYIPLFLPITVPVLTSFSLVRKLWNKVRLAPKVKIN